MTPRETAGTEINDNIDNISSTIGIIGGVVGFSLGIFTAAIVVQPRLASLQSLPSGSATTLTAFIFICGGIQLFTAAGLAVGQEVVAPIVVAGAKCLATDTRNFRFFRAQASTVESELIVNTSTYSPLLHDEP